MRRRSSRIALAGLFLLVATIGCPKGAGLDAEQCAQLAVTSGALALLIADLATSNEEKLEAVAQGVAIAELAVQLGCPIVIDLIDGLAPEDGPERPIPSSGDEGTDLSLFFDPD